MDEKEALEIIKEACASISANLQVHQRVQQAILVIEQALKEKPKKK